MTSPSPTLTPFPRSPTQWRHHHPYRKAVTWYPVTTWRCAGNSHSSCVRQTVPLCTALFSQWQWWWWWWQRRRNAPWQNVPSVQLVCQNYSFLQSPGATCKSRPSVHRDCARPSVHRDKARPSVHRDCTEDPGCKKVPWRGKIHFLELSDFLSARLPISETKNNTGRDLTAVCSKFSFRRVVCFRVLLCADYAILQFLFVTLHV